MAAFTGQLRSNEIFSALYNMIISQEVFADNLGEHQTLVDKARVDGSLYVNTFNSFTTGYGYNQLNLAYTDSLNQVRVNYSNDYRSIHHIETTFEDAFGVFNKVFETAWVFGVE